jgi:hypothetical protein
LPQGHVANGMFSHHRLTFTRPSGSVGNLTMSATHLAVRLTAAAAGDTADSVAAYECS